MKKIWRVGDSAYVPGNWHIFFRIRDAVATKRSLAAQYLQSGRDNEAIELLNSAIKRLSEAIRRNNNKPTEKTVSLNLLLMMLSMYSDLANIYYKNFDITKLDETLSILLKIDYKDYENVESSLLGLIFERVNRLELAESFYAKAAYSSCWHAFRVACSLGHKDFALKMIDKYIEGDFKEISYDVWGESEVNKSAFSIWLLENENDCRLKVYENSPKCVQEYLVYGKLLEEVDRYSDALNLYKDFVRIFSKAEEQVWIINESKELDTAATFFETYWYQIDETGKFSKSMWDVLMSYFNNKVGECEKRIFV